ncbi:hypothetical protein Tco_0059692 [Tanacetum coccineum]
MRLPCSKRESRMIYMTQNIGAHAVVHIFNRIIFAIAKEVGISAGKEVDIGLDEGRDKPLCPVDMLLTS